MTVMTCCECESRQAVAGDIFCKRCGSNPLVCRQDEDGLSEIPYQRARDREEAEAGSSAARLRVLTRRNAAARTKAPVETEMERLATVRGRSKE